MSNVIPINGARTIKAEIVIPADSLSDSPAKDLFSEAQKLVAELKQTKEIFRELIEQNAPLSYTEAEAAEILRISELTLKRLRRDGKISYSLVGRNPHYTKEHLAGYLESVQKLSSADRRKKR